MNTYYFDNGATTKTKPEVVEAMMPYFSEEYGNPSSVYGLARDAKKAVQDAREKVAKLVQIEMKFTLWDVALKLIIQP